MTTNEKSSGWESHFSAWGWEAPKQPRSLSRHGALVLLNFYDLFKECRAKHQHTKSDNFDPAKHFDSKDLCQRIADRINGSGRRLVRRELTKEAVFAHLLYLEGHVNAGRLVSVHVVKPNDTHPVVSLGPAGEELCDLLVQQDLRTYVEGDRDKWQAPWLWARMCHYGKSTPNKWTASIIRSLTGLTAHQFRRVFVLLRDHGAEVRGFDGSLRIFPAGCLVARADDDYIIPMEYRFAGSEVVLEDESEDEPQLELDLNTPEPTPTVVSPDLENTVPALPITANIVIGCDDLTIQLLKEQAQESSTTLEELVSGWVKPHIEALHTEYERKRKEEAKLRHKKEALVREREALLRRVLNIDNEINGLDGSSEPEVKMSEASSV